MSDVIRIFKQVVFPHFEKRIRYSSWTSVLTLLANALTEQKSSEAIPPIDHGRINYFLKQWMSYASVTKKYPQFHTALMSFHDAWSRVHNIEYTPDDAANEEDGDDDRESVAEESEVVDDDNKSVAKESDSSKYINEQIILGKAHLAGENMRTVAPMFAGAEKEGRGAWGDTYLLLAFNILLCEKDDCPAKLGILGVAYITHDSYEKLGNTLVGKQVQRTDLLRFFGDQRGDDDNKSWILIEVECSGQLCDYILLNIEKVHFELLHIQKNGNLEIIPTNNNGNCYFDALSILYNRVFPDRTLSAEEMRTQIMTIVRDKFLTITQKTELDTLLLLHRAENATKPSTDTPWRDALRQLNRTPPGNIVETWKVSSYWNGLLERNKMDAAATDISNAYVRIIRHILTNTKPLLAGMETSRDDLLGSVVGYEQKYATHKNKDVLWDHVQQLKPSRRPTIQLVQGSYVYENDKMYVCFANQRIGGGILSSGFVQEERAVFESNQFPLQVLWKFNENERSTKLDLIHLDEKPAILKVRHLFNLKQNINRRNLENNVYKNPNDFITLLDSPKEIYWLNMAAVRIIDMDPHETDMLQNALKKMLLVAYRAFREAIDVLKAHKREFVIQTGNWGTGAFGHNYRVALVIQYIAAWWASQDSNTALTLRYHTYDENIHKYLEKRLEDVQQTDASTLLSNLVKSTSTTLEARQERWKEQQKMKQQQNRENQQQKMKQRRMIREQKKKKEEQKGEGMKRGGPRLGGPKDAQERAMVLNVGLF